MASGLSPESAAAEAVAALLERVGTESGLILVAPSGRLGLACSSESMPWAAAWDGMLETGD
jgi:isoaspartyl peptidase/L-asparaginase-like protein (Ntn-hydrolase superfamily)